MTYVLFEPTKSNNMDKIWDQWWENISIKRELQKLEENDLLPIFLKYLPKTGKILEAGCGLGQWVIYLKQKGYNIIGIDFAQEAIDMAKGFDKTLPIEFGDVTKIPYHDNHFDAYISLGVVEHFEKGPYLALKEANRVLKPDGLIFISIPVFNLVRHITSPIERIFYYLKENRNIRKLLGKENYPNKHFIEYRFTIKEFTRILEVAEFKIEKIIPFGHIGCGLFNQFFEPLPFLRTRLLTNSFQFLAALIKTISPWLAPHSVIWIGRRK